jgi:type VI protein secretion system component VasF
MDTEHEVEQAFDLRRAHTPDQLARQKYLRRVVLRLMLVAAAFVLVVVYLLWQRGLLRVIS